MATVVHTGRRGRPAIDRLTLLQLLAVCPRVGRRIVRFNQRDAARRLQCHRTTVLRALGDLERWGYVRRFGLAGPTGLYVVLESRAMEVLAYAESLALSA